MLTNQRFALTKSKDQIVVNKEENFGYIKEKEMYEIVTKKSQHL